MCVRIVWRAPRAARLFLYDFKAPRITHVFKRERVDQRKVQIAGYFDLKKILRLSHAARHPASATPSSTYFAVLLLLLWSCRPLSPHSRVILERLKGAAVAQRSGDQTPSSPLHITAEGQRVMADADA